MDKPADAPDRQEPGNWQPRQDPLVWAVFGVYLALAITYSYVMELGHGPDESDRHYPYVQWLAQEATLPPADPTVDCGALELHPPLYYLSLVPVYAVAHRYGDRVALRTLRWTSPFLILAALLLWFAVIRRACADQRYTSLFCLALTAWWPNLFVAAGCLNNDVGAILSSAVLLYLVSVGDLGRPGARAEGMRGLWTSPLGSAALAGGVIGLGALMKSSALTVCVPVLAVAVARQHGRLFYRDGYFWLRGLMAAATCIAVCGWWYLRNLELHGALVPIPQGYSLIPAHLTKLEALMGGLVGPVLLRAINGLWVSVFAGAVWFPEWTHPLVYWPLRALTAAGVIGVSVGLWRVCTGRAVFAPGQAKALVLSAAGFGAIYLATLWVAVFVHFGVHQGGRYLLPFLPGLTIPLGLGLKQLVPARLRAATAAALLAFLVALSFLAWYHMVTYWNPRVLEVSGPFG